MLLSKCILGLASLAVVGEAAPSINKIYERRAAGVLEPRQRGGNRGGGNNNNNNNSGNDNENDNNNNNNGGQDALTLDPDVVATGSQQDGSDGGEDGQAASAT
jgi:hypothetical protein